LGTLVFPAIPDLAGGIKGGEGVPRPRAGLSGRGGVANLDARNEEMVPMAVSFPVKGGCHCGDIRYGLRAEPEFSGVCHCESCRRSSGTESVGWLTVAVDAFTVDRGEISHYVSSPGVSRGFCPRCGTTLTYRNNDETVDITLASLDDPEIFPPRVELWLEERLSWNPANPLLEQHERGSGAG
jgi:hypothetical protein